MPKYVIERELPGAGNLNGDEVKGISQKILRRAQGPRSRNPMGAKLCDRRQDLLHIHLSQQGIDRKACEAGRFSGEQHLRNQTDHRSDQRRMIAVAPKPRRGTACFPLQLLVPESRIASQATRASSSAQARRMANQTKMVWLPSKRVRAKKKRTGPDKRAWKTSRNFIHLPLALRVPIEYDNRNTGIESRFQCVVQSNFFSKPFFNHQEPFSKEV